MATRRLPYGYRFDRTTIIIDDIEGKVVKEIYELFCEGVYIRYRSYRQKLILIKMFNQNIKNLMLLHIAELVHYKKNKNQAMKHKLNTIQN